jgi:serine phosphatase RsbU (regulator of sigma subunit)/uncharacterized protein HemY
MFRKYYIFLILYQFILGISAFSQENINNNSLLIALKNSKQDTNKITILTSIIKNCLSSDTSNVDRYIKNCFELSLKLKNKKGLANSLQFIGIRTLKKQNRNLALDYFMRAAALFEEINEEFEYAKTCHYIGIIYYEQTDFPDALNYLNKSSKILEKILDKKNVPSVYNDIGRTYLKQDKYREALEYFYKALRISEEDGEAESISFSYFNIASVYETQKDYSKSIEYYEKSLKLSEEKKLKSRIIECSQKLGNVYYKSNKLDNARSIITKTIQLSEEIGDSITIAWCYITLGEIENSNENHLKAIDFYKESYKIFKIKNLEDGLAMAYLFLGKSYYQLNRFNEAIDYLKIAENLANKVNSLEIKRDIAESLFRSYNKTNQHQAALLYHIKFKDLSDSISNKETITRLAQLEVIYDQQKREKQFQLLRLLKETLQIGELKRQKMVSIISIIGIILMIFASVLLIYGYRGKRKAYALLMLKNKEINQQTNEIISQKDELISQNIQLSKQNEYIQGSIRYALTIQKAILPEKEVINKYFESFILYQPKDIVSGDFYWFYAIPSDQYSQDQLISKTILAVIDCTGHGVPGAFMSLIGYRSLNEIVIEKKIHSPAEILSRLDHSIRTALKQEANLLMDGMDLSICLIEKKDNQSKVVFSGAKRPLIYFKHQAIETILLKGIQRGIGGILKSQIGLPFINVELILNSGDMLYLFTDGLVDQNDKSRKKFGLHNLMNILQSIGNLPVDDQYNTILDYLNDHMNNCDQRDDITLVGIKI